LCDADFVWLRFNAATAWYYRDMKAMKLITPMIMAGAAATAIFAAPIAVAENFALAAGTQTTQFAPQSPGGDGCANGACGNGGPQGGGGCTTDGTCGNGGPQGGGGCTADGKCGHGGPGGGGGCVPGVGCFEYGS
jgi:hypothetical protein